MSTAHSIRSKLKKYNRTMQLDMKLPNLLARLIPYHLGVRIQRGWLRQPWIQALFYSRKVALIKKMAGLCENAEIDLDNLILCSLMANSWRNWRKAAIKKLDISDCSTIRGMEQLSAALAKGKGVILITTHSIRSRLLTALVRSQKAQEIFFAHKIYEDHDRPHMISAIARQMAEAIKVLKSGGVLNIAGDGLMGEGGFSIPFHGRRVTFRAGYADLALRTGAVLIPTFQYMDQDGRIELEIAPEIVPPAGNREDQIENMVQQYVQALSDRWPRLIHSLAWFKLQQYVDMPASEIV